MICCTLSGAQDRLFSLSRGGKIRGAWIPACAGMTLKGQFMNCPYERVGCGAPTLFSDSGRHMGLPLRNDDEEIASSARGGLAMTYRRAQCTVPLPGWSGCSNLPVRASRGAGEIAASSFLEGLLAMTYGGTWIPACAGMACCTLSGAQDRRGEIASSFQRRTRNDKRRAPGFVLPDQVRDRLGSLSYHRRIQGERIIPLTLISPSRGERRLKSPLPPLQKGGFGRGRPAGRPYIIRACICRLRYRAPGPSLCAPLFPGEHTLRRRSREASYRRIRCARPDGREEAGNGWAPWTS